MATMRSEFNPDHSATELVQTASSLLSTITSQAGVVTVPRPSQQPLRQVEFLPLSGDRVLVILVVNGREVQNRIIHTRAAIRESELREAAALVNQRFAGHPLDGFSVACARKWTRRGPASTITSRRTLDLASRRSWTRISSNRRMSAWWRANRGCWARPRAGEMAKLRELFDAFERKQDILHLLERCSRADGVQIFIGEEAGYEVFGDYSVITSPYDDGGRILGVLGVIGPTRMAYERVIPIVDVTARMLSAALSH